MQTRTSNPITPNDSFSIDACIPARVITRQRSNRLLWQLGVAAAALCATGIRPLPAEGAMHDRIQSNAFVKAGPFMNANRTELTLGASIEVECTGKSGSQVALRWAYPDYNSADPFMPLFTVPCGVGKRTTALQLRSRNSEFEVQTEGGIQTSYAIKVTLANGSFIRLDHNGSPDIITRGSGFTISRSSGPNKYGEQNFRVVIPQGKVAAVHLEARRQGNTADAQMALRWGHPDFHEHEYFSLWKVQSAVALSRDFQLRDANSEFEIQTEGGEHTAYHLAIWLNFGQGTAMQPNIEITHKLSGTGVLTGMNAGDKFLPTTGNAFGEMNVRVYVPALPEFPPPQPSWTTVTLFRQQAPLAGGPISYSGQLGIGLSGGHFSAIRSAENYDVELVGHGGATTDDCGKNNKRTVLLRAHQQLTDQDFETLYGINPVYPAPFVGCSYQTTNAFSLQVYTTPGAH